MFSAKHLTSLVAYIQKSFFNSPPHTEYTLSILLRSCLLMVIVSKGVFQKVVVILTYIDGVSWGGMKWLVNALANDMNPGDELILLGLLHHVNPPTLSFDAAAKLFGIKGKDEHKKIFGSTKKIVEEELKRRKDDLRKNPGIVQLQKLYEIETKVKVIIELEAGSSCKVAAIRAAKRLGATWVILDREMKKDKVYFMDRLPCKISSMKSNNTIVLLRGSIEEEHVTYDEMIPSYSWEDLSPLSQKFPGSQGKSPRRELLVHCSNSFFLDNSHRQASTSSLMETKRSPARMQYNGNTGRSNKSIGKDKSPPRAVTSQENGKNEARGTLTRRNLQQLLNIGEDNGIHESQTDREFENSVCSFCKNKRPKIGLQRDFTYAELHEATEGFSRNKFLSEGGFGFVFEGILKEGIKIAVKQHKAASLQGEKEFLSEVRVLRQARHQNLVMLLGSCTEGRHRLLVYEYVCNGSLEKHLSDDSELPLSWGKRIKIALGAAKGLKYLHSRNIVHRDMRPGNILITHDHESMLGDFGLAKAQQDDKVHSLEKGVVGTLGYVAPEYAESGKMSTKTDVYSFGVVLLQLITGLGTTDKIPEGKSLIGWAKPLLETRNYPDLIDKRISESYDVHQLFWMVRVAEQCLKKDPDNRCTMEQVVHYLKCIKEGKANFITYFSPTERDESDNSGL